MPRRQPIQRHTFVVKLIPFAPGLSGEFHVLKKVVTLLLNCFGEIFPLSDVPLDDPNNKGEAQLRGEIVEDPKSGLIYRGKQ